MHQQLRNSDFELLAYAHGLELCNCSPNQVLLPGILTGILTVSNAVMQTPIPSIHVILGYQLTSHLHGQGS